MSVHTQLAKLSAPPGAPPSFGDVVAYLRGVSDAVHAMKRSANSTWPTAMDLPLGAQSADLDSSPPQPENRRGARLTLRFGETDIALDGILVFPHPPATLPVGADRGGARLVDLEGADDSSFDAAEQALRGTLPYGSPAVSIVPMYGRRSGAATSIPPFIRNEYDQETSLPYSALALSLVPVALGIASQFPDDSGERVSAIHLRVAPLSPALYALTGTDDWLR